MHGVSILSRGYQTKNGKYTVVFGAIGGYAMHIWCYKEIFWCYRHQHLVLSAYHGVIYHL